ncbi:MAG: outer membrane beta-barrel protein [Bacteriovorax sp.]|nr:outer membrane beta-barrel protein [Bacteriovorax sp.]
MNKILLASLFFINTAHAAFMIDTMSGYSSSTDSKTTTDISDVSNHIYIGASLGVKQKFFIGQNITLFTHQLKAATTNKVNTLELGPRLTYFFSEENVFYGTLGWNPYAKGKRTVSSVTDDISGYGLLVGLGAEVKINRNFHIGGSLNYHRLSISKAISASNVATSVSDTYSSLMPMINLSFRFR